jgi:hypothetical protein
MFKDYINIICTLADWEFGFGFTLPSKSEYFFMGTKLKSGIRLFLFLGLITIQIGKDPEVIEFENEDVEEFYTGLKNNV